MQLLLIILSSGLFLGWLLGSKDTVNLFGSSVSSQMLDIRKAALIAGIFVVLGAVFHGSATTQTVHELGNVTDPMIAFLIALVAAMVVLLLIKIKLAVSTSQTVVGAILGWVVFSTGSLNLSRVSEFLVAWIMAPVAGIIISALLFILFRWTIRRSKIHMLQLDAWSRVGLIAGIALSAFGLGANNIGNIAGVFYHFSPDIQLSFGLFTVNGLQFLSLLGAVAITAGLVTYSYRAYSSPGKRDVLSLMPETAIVVLFSQAIVLFLFSSAWFRNLVTGSGIPWFQLVPVSSTQIVIGAVLGIGLVKGAREIDNRTLAGMGIGWITAPLSAGVLMYMLLFLLNRVFGLPLQREVPYLATPLADGPRTFNMIVPGLAVLTILVFTVFVYLIFRQQKARLKMEKDLLIQQNQLYHSQKAMYEMEMRTISVENEALNTKLNVKRKEFMDIALNINEQRLFLEKLSATVNDINNTTDGAKRSEMLNDMALYIKQRMSFSRETKEFYMRVEDIHKDFHLKLKSSYPNLTEFEKRLAGLLRLNLSTKEMAALLNISPKSVEVARYRLKKKLQLSKDQALHDFISNL
ncbi:MAG: inorganic phosphate transporter [Bacteroidales bacterium]|nr:inorganic phosphate transporter [Bacteroidales bacterium]